MRYQNVDVVLNEAVFVTGIVLTLDVLGCACLHIDVERAESGMIERGKDVFHVVDLLAFECPIFFPC